MTSLLRNVIKHVGQKGFQCGRTSSPHIPVSTTVFRSYAEEVKKVKRKKGKTPTGKLDAPWETPVEEVNPTAEKEPLEHFPNNKNPITGEIGGPRGPEPTRYGDWERKGRVTDF